MVDMDAVTAAKSDQFNADDLVGTELRVTVENVMIRAGTEQPITVKLAGHDKVFRPCKTVARIMKAAWGADSAVYKGRSLLLYRDDSVTWGGMKVGGIRVRAISDISAPLVLALQEKKGSRKVTTVQPLAVEQQEPANDPAFVYANQYIVEVGLRDTVEALAELQSRQAKRFADLRAKRPDQADRVQVAIDRKLASLSPNDGTLADDNPTANEGRSDADHGETHTDDGETF